MLQELYNCKSPNYWKCTLPPRLSAKVIRMGKGGGLGVNAFIQESTSSKQGFRLRHRHRWGRHCTTCHPAPWFAMVYHTFWHNSQFLLLAWPRLYSVFQIPAPDRTRNLDSSQLCRAKMDLS